jgi:hypothetical protein
MLPSYPGATEPPSPQAPPRPATVRTAIQVMYAGAAVTLLNMIVEVATLSTTKAGLARRSPGLTASQVHGLGQSLLMGFIAGGVIAAVAWIFIARGCGQGRNWARITGTVLFGLATLDLAGYLTIPFAAAVKVTVLLVWLAGVTAVVLLWRRGSRAFFTGSGPS